MDINSLLGSSPLWLIFTAIVSIILLSIYLGVFISGRRQKKSTDQDEMPIDTIVGATLGLLAFILAFTFGFTTSRFDSRKQLLLEDVNSIGTTYLRAGFLPEPHCTEVRSLLREYVDIRIEFATHPEKFNTSLQKSEKLQEEMWKHAEAVSITELKNPEIVALFVESLNETIDLQTKRLTVTLVYRIPDVMWYALLSLLVLSMFELGYLFRKTNKPNWIIILAVSLAFSVVVMMIITFNRPDGKMKLNQQPMLELQKSLDKDRISD